MNHRTSPQANRCASGSRNQPVSFTKLKARAESPRAAPVMDGLGPGRKHPGARAQTAGLRCPPLCPTRPSPEGESRSRFCVGVASRGVTLSPSSDRSGHDVKTVKTSNDTDGDRRGPRLCPQGTWAGCPVETVSPLATFLSGTFSASLSFKDTVL